MDLGDPLGEEYESPKSTLPPPPCRKKEGEHQAGDGREIWGLV